MSLKANQSTTISTEGGIDADDTEFTLTTGAFDNKTSADKVPLIIDYDNSAKLEVVVAYVNGTAVSGMTRAQNGTAAAAHSQGANVCIGSVPKAWEYWLRNDLTGIGARAYLSADQDNLVSGTATKVTLDTENYDLGGDFASDKFIAPRAGTYLVTANVRFKSLVADKLYTSLMDYR